MGQFDNFKSIAMLFLGAFLVSFAVIAFLNVEIQSRSSHGVKIKNENLFEVLGKKISEMMSTLRERNSYRRSFIYHIFVAENTTRKSLRKLQFFTEGSTGVDSVAQNDFKIPHHHFRHEKKIRRLTESFLKEKNDSASDEVLLDLKGKHKSKGNSFISARNNINDDRTITENAKNSTNENFLEEMEVHQRCYSTNDVLEIIAVTCLVNFIFWFLIILCVNIFTRNQKIWKFNSFESLTSIGSGSECELNQNSFRKKEGSFPSIFRNQNIYRDYVNLSTTETEGNDPDVMAHPEPGSRSFPGEEPKRGKISLSSENGNGREKWIQQRFIHLSNIFFDSVSLDNLKSVKKKTFVSRNKNSKIVNSFSMDDLIF